MNNTVYSYGRYGNTKYDGSSRSASPTGEGVLRVYGRDRYMASQKKFNVTGYTLNSITPDQEKTIMEFYKNLIKNGKKTSSGNVVDDYNLFLNSCVDNACAGISQVDFILALLINGLSPYDTEWNLKLLDLFGADITQTEYPAEDENEDDDEDEDEKKKNDNSSWAGWGAENGSSPR